MCPSGGGRLAAWERFKWLPVFRRGYADTRRKLAAQGGAHTAGWAGEEAGQSNRSLILLVYGCRLLLVANRFGSYRRL